MVRDDLGNRMKGYEDISRIYLTKRMPLIIRVDGRAFHTFTKGFQKPFDNILMDAMKETAKELCKNIPGCKLAYTQSDEISLLITDYDSLQTSPWFDKNLQKLVSISASIATLYFDRIFYEKYVQFSHELNIRDDIDLKVRQKFEDCRMAYHKALKSGAVFDARAFVLPKEEVCNYFIWRQQDASRNSVQMVAQANFSHKSLQGLKNNQLQDKLMLEKNINWNDFSTPEKRGLCVIKNQEGKWESDMNIPIFTQDRDYINKRVFIDE